MNSLCEWEYLQTHNKSRAHYSEFYISLAVVLYYNFDEIFSEIKDNQQDIFVTWKILFK